MVYDTSVTKYCIYSYIYYNQREYPTLYTTLAVHPHNLCFHFWRKQNILSNRTCPTNSRMSITFKWDHICSILSSCFGGVTEQQHFTDCPLNIRFLIKVFKKWYWIPKRVSIIWQNPFQISLQGCIIVPSDTMSGLSKSVFCARLGFHKIISIKMPENYKP